MTNPNSLKLPLLSLISLYLLLCLCMTNPNSLIFQKNKIYLMNIFAKLSANIKFSTCCYGNKRPPYKPIKRFISLKKQTFYLPLHYWYKPLQFMTFH